jgi:hypothetical protein
MIVGAALYAGWIVVWTRRESQAVKDEYEHELGVPTAQRTRRAVAVNVTLLVAGIPLVTALGYSSAVAVVTAVLASITLLPAVLALVGGHIEALRLPAFLRPRPKDLEGGFWGGWGPLPGPWLEPGFRKKGYAQMTVRDRICVALIDRFNEMLSGVAGKPPFGHVRHLDLRNTLPRGPKYKEWWANELHPTGRGFEAVTRKFAAIV